MEHYQKGGEIPFENRQFTKNSDGTIVKFSMDYYMHKYSYDFADPMKLLEDFFTVVDINFVTDGRKELITKSTFSIQNYQPPPEGEYTIKGFGAHQLILGSFLMISLRPH